MNCPPPPPALTLVHARTQTPRHGIFPAVDAAGRIWLAGGGVHMGSSSSDVTEIYTPGGGGGKRTARST